MPADSLTILKVISNPESEEDLKANSHDKTSKTHKRIIRNYSYDDFDRLKYSPAHCKELNIDMNDGEKNKMKSSLSNPVDIKHSIQTMYDIKSNAKIMYPLQGDRNKYYGLSSRTCGCTETCPYKDGGQDGGVGTCDLDDCGEDTDLLHHCDAQLINLDNNRPYLWNGSRRRKSSNQILARKIDEYCRGVFPLLFVIFNILYWTHYLDS